MTDRKNFGILREAPKPRLRKITDDEALDLAQKAFRAARIAQMDVLGHGIGQMLFNTSPVNYSRLRSLRGAARDQVKKAQLVNQLIDEAIEAFEATVPVKP